MSAIAVGPVAALERVGPRRRALERVGRAHEVEVGDEAQRPEVLDRLVGRPVLAEVHAVVREDEERLQVRERREADRRAHVVAEDEERRAERDEPVARRAMPFTNAPIACSRMPKWTLRPSNLPFGERRRALRCTSSSRG